MAGFIDADSRVKVTDISAGTGVFTGTVSITNNATSDSTTTGALKVTGGIGAGGNIYGAKVHNAVWNDIADCIEIPNTVRLQPGKCYVFDGNEYRLSKEYLDKDTLIFGIHSDTYGYGLGHDQNRHQIHTSIGGFVLAYVDQDYPAGTPLTCTTDGYLTKIKDEDKVNYPERVVASFWKPENNHYYNKLLVSGRKWVKIK